MSHKNKNVYLLVGFGWKNTERTGNSNKTLSFYLRNKTKAVSDTTGPRRKKRNMKRG